MHTLITGAASGIGKATALRLSSRSAISIADKNFDGAQAVTQEINAAGGKAQALGVDVADHDVGAGSGEESRYRFAYPSGAACHECGAAIE